MSDTIKLRSEKTMHSDGLEHTQIARAAAGRLQGMDPDHRALVYRLGRKIYGFLYY